MAGVSSTIALNRWDSIVKQTQPVFDDIESGDFTNRDLAKVAQLLRKQSKLASTVFEQNLKLLSEQAKTYVPAVKQELAKIGEFVSPKNISIVIEAIYKELVAKNIKTIVDKIKEIINSDIVKKFQETAKSFYNDYAKFYGKVPVIDVKKDQVVASSAKKDVSDTDGLMQKVYDMMEYAYPALAQYPKSEKFALCTDIKHCMDIMLERTIEAQKKYYKKTTLQELDVEIMKLRAYLRLSHELGFLPMKKYEVWSGMVVEIGKMLGGWLKTVNGQPKNIGNRP